MDRISEFRKEPIHRISYEIEDENGIPELKVKFGVSGSTQGRRIRKHSDYRTIDQWNYFRRHEHNPGDKGGVRGVIKT